MVEFTEQLIIAILNVYSVCNMHEFVFIAIAVSCGKRVAIWRNYSLATVRPNAKHFLNLFKRRY